jgi:hypothetical protein
MANMTSRKKMILASSIIAIAFALVAMVVCPTYVGNAQADYVYALNEENWAMTEENTVIADPSVANIRRVTINAKGYAFERVDEETLKQFEAETQLIATIEPKEEGATTNVDVTGIVKVNDAVYTIQSGTAVLGTKRHVLFIRCEGVDEEGNKITLKLGAVYFWWGGKTYALRSKALLQTSEKPMLLLQRGIAKI